MLLRIEERLHLLELLPREENYASLRTIAVARSNMAFSAQELVDWGIKQEVTEQGIPRVSWNPQFADAEADIPIDEWTTQTIKNKLMELNEQHKLTNELVSLFEKFILDYQ